MSASGISMNGVAMRTLLSRFDSYYEMAETIVCDSCTAAKPDTVKSGDAIGPFFCQRHATPLFQYKDGFRPLWFKTVMGQSDHTTACNLAVENNWVVRSQNECVSCIDEYAPCGCNPDETGPFLCLEHNTPVFTYCKNLDWEPLWFHTSDN